MHPETRDLQTRWIDGSGAKAIMLSAGIIPDEIPEFSVAKRDRETYIRELLHTLAYAVAEKSANPAALVEGDEEDAFYSYADRAIQKWAEKSAAELEELLESL